MAKLDKYRAMRDFEATPEPSGDEAVSVADDPRFVIQEHHATALHWDLRLERDGVLVSWAVPKGLPKDPRVNNLAVHTEDHPLMYLDFHGDIPKGSYGAGQMTIWDTGTYECHKFEDREVQVTLRGERANGRYVLFRTRGNQWMIHRMDPPEDPTRELMPEGWRPMLAIPGRLPDDESAWGFEVDWSGTRATVACEGGRVTVLRPEGEDAAHLYPELRAMGRAFGQLEVIVDGDLVALDDSGRPDQKRMARRDAAGSDSAVRRLASSVPVTYMISDLLWLEGHPATALGYADRRRLLEELELAGPHWQTPASHAGEGAALLEATRAQGLTGVVAKRLDSPYRPGESSPDWVAVGAGG
jgi:bifunctional non-homologous end joining protein LigD